MSNVVEILKDSDLLLNDYAMSILMRRYVNAYPRIYGLQRHQGLTKLIINSNQATTKMLDVHDDSSQRRKAASVYNNVERPLEVFNHRRIFIVANTNF